MPQNLANPDAFRNAELDRLLAEHHADSYVLPKLVEEKSALLEWLKDLQEWLKGYFDFKPGIDMPVGFWDVFFQILGWGLFLAIVVAVVVLIVILLNKFVFKNHAVLVQKPTKAARVAADEAWEKLIAEAVAANDFALAARLRWKLHLKRKKADETWTPWEYAGHFLQTGEAGERAAIFSGYALMFGAKTSPAREFSAWDVLLKSREGEDKHAA